MYYNNWLWYKWEKCHLWQFEELNVNLRRFLHHISLKWLSRSRFKVSRLTFKAAVRNLFWLNMTQNQYLNKYITSQCSKLSPYFSPIHNGYLIIMFSNLSGIRREGYVNIKKFSRLLDNRTRGSCRWRIVYSLFYPHSPLNTRFIRAGALLTQAR